MLALRRFSTAAAGTAAAASGPVTKQSSLFYRYVLSSNVTYLTFVFTGAFIFGGAFSKGGDLFWEMKNKGRLYKDIDWSKWNSNWKSE